MSRELAAIFYRLGTTAESWWSRLAKLSQGRLFGRTLAATRDRLQEFANRLGVRGSSTWGGARRDESSGRLELAPTRDRRPGGQAVSRRQGNDGAPTPRLISLRAARGPRCPLVAGNPAA